MPETPTKCPDCGAEVVSTKRRLSVAALTAMVACMDTMPKPRERRALAGIRRRDRCPCGSGRQYRRCCGRRQSKI